MSDHAGDLRALEKVSAWRRGERISIDMGRNIAARDAATPPLRGRAARRPDPAAERRAAEAEAACPPSRVPDAPWRGR